MSRRPGAAAVLISVVVLGAAPAGAQAKAVPQLGFAGHARPVLRLVDGNPLATVTVVLENTGGADAAGVTLLLSEDNTVAEDACGIDDLSPANAVITQAPCASKPAPLVLAPGAARRLSLTFRVSQTTRLRTPLVEARSSVPGVPSAFTEATVSRSLGNGRLWWPIWAALAAAAMFLAAGAYVTRTAPHRDPSDRAGVWGWASAKVFTASSWTFRDSWATNVAAVGGVLGTVLGSSGFFNEVLPGVSAGRFTGFSLLFGALAVVAPIVYTALGRRHQTKAGTLIMVGTVAGLLVASAATIAAVVGELTTLALLVHMSDAPGPFQTICFTGLTFGGLVVLCYAVRSARWLSHLPEPPEPGDVEGLLAAPSFTPAASGYAVMSAGAL